MTRVAVSEALEAAVLLTADGKLLLSARAPNNIANLSR